MEKEYNKGDVIVCLEDRGGWVHKGEMAVLGGKFWDKEAVNKNKYLKAKTKYYPKGGGCSIRTKFRHATEGEIRWFNKGTLYISEIPKVSDNYEIY